MTLERWETLLATMEDLGLVPKGAVKAQECFRANL
jgi:hypothetical protein